MAKPADKPLELIVTERGDARVVRVFGSVGMNETEQLRSALAEAAVTPGRTVVLDLSEMDFICSLGLGAMIAAYQELRRREGALRLVSPRPPIREMLEATRLTKLFPIYSSVEEAIA